MGSAVTGASVRRVFLGAFVLALVPTAMGCAAAEPEEDVTGASQALVGGTTTLEHPEIGRFYRADGMCTGTLVRPDVVLTAAHCFPLADDLDVSKASPSWRFLVTTADGVNHRYVVDRAHSILQRSELGSGNDWRTYDLALLHLAAAVPAAIAEPAALASEWTLPGARVALFGYGCTTAGTHEGVGTKRTIESSWTFGQWLGFSTSHALCQGDSGGPLLDVSTNAVLGTNSGADGKDRFSDVPKSRVAIDAMIAHWAR